MYSTAYYVLTLLGKESESPFSKPKMGINQKRKNLDSPSPVRTINRQRDRPPIPHDRKIENPGPVQNQPTANSADENESPIQSKLRILFVIGIFIKKS